MSDRLAGLVIRLTFLSMRTILNHVFDAPPGKHVAHFFWVGMTGIAAALFMANASGTAHRTSSFPLDSIEKIELLANPSASSIAVDSYLLTREIVIRRGDTLSSVVARMGIDDPAALQFLRTDRKAETLARQLVPGKAFHAKIDESGSMHVLTFPLNGSDAQALTVRKIPEGYTSTIHPIDLEKRGFFKSATIQHSLFGAADAAGIPESVAIQLSEIFGGDIDFHRGLRKGDRFSVSYETNSHQGRLIGPYTIRAAEFVNDGKVLRAFWHQDSTGTGGYYDTSGKSVRKAFLRSPLEFSRISSGFSNSRYHPVLREMRAHRGIDYAAPMGTRVKATGDGVIEVTGAQGGYGKVVMVRHAGNRLTVYGHLSGFAPGIVKGVRVSQGQVIGYVGATGIATGPHLHYEFRVDGVHRNPLAAALPDAPPISADLLPDFKASVANLSKGLEAIRDVQIALLD